MNRAANNRAPSRWRRAAVAVGLLCAVPAAVAQPPATAVQATPDCTSVTVSVTLDLLLPATVHGTLCRPATGATNPTVQLLMPGASYNSSYWDGEGIVAASFVAVATAAGSITLAIDRIGTGASSPALSATVTATTEANIFHQIITALHQGTVDGQHHDQVGLIGHSLGSMESLLEASTYRDVTELALTGYAHLISVPVLVSVFLTGLRPADLWGFPRQDPGWLTTVPGTREALFDAPDDVDPAVVAADEAHRDIVSAATVPDGFAAVLTSLASQSLTGIPILEVDGGQDRIFCGPLTPGCPTAAALYTREAPSFPTNSLGTVVLPDAGHDVSLARDGDQAATAIQSWLAGASAGHAVHGPRPGSA
jgi:pimeloyl-ACP methyl ester carboxylesterase